MKSFSKRSFRAQMLTLAVSTFAAMLTVSVLTFANSVRIIKENRMQDIAMMVSNYEHNLYLTAERYYVLLNTLRYSSDVQQAMTAVDQAEFADSIVQLRKELQFYKTACPGVTDIILTGKANNISIRNHALSDIPSELFTSDNLLPFYSGAYFLMDHYGTMAPVFFLGSTVSLGMVTGGAGTALLAVDGATLTMDFTENLAGDAGAYYYFIDKDGVIFSSNAPDEEETRRIFTHLGDIKQQEELTGFRAGGYNISVQHLNSFGITLVVALSQHAILKMAFRAFSWTFLIITVLSVLIVLVVTKALHNILRPMDSMMQVMDSINLEEISDRSVRARVEGFEEMEVMAAHFNQMLDTISRLSRELIESTENLYRLDILNRESELNYLRSQINPHFLYNTLETIRGMAVREQAPLVQKMMGALIRVFRYSVREGSIVPLSEEMDMIQSYLLIQALRFGDRLSVEYAVDVAARRCALPKMLLQPIVENLAQHGIEESTRDGGHIRIAARVEGERLIIDCSDNGCGMSPEELAQVYDNIYATGHPAERGIGLRNVYGRLKLLYADHFQFVIASQKAEGTNIHIEIPAGGMENGTHQNTDRG